MSLTVYCIYFVLGFLEAIVLKPLVIMVQPDLRAVIRRHAAADCGIQRSNTLAFIKASVIMWMSCVTSSCGRMGNKHIKQVLENKSAWGTVSSYHVRPYDSSPHILFCVPHCCSNIKAHLCVFCELPCCRCLRKKQTNQTQWCSASSADRIVSTDYELLHFLILVGKLSDVMPGLLFVSPQSCFRVKHRFLPKWRKDFKYFSDYKKNVTKIACHLFLN